MKKVVKVKPNAKTRTLTELDDGTLKITLKSTPTDGKANQELIKLLAKTYGVPQSHITIKSGHTSRNKVIEIIA